MARAAALPETKCDAIVLSGQHDNQPQRLAMGLYRDAIAQGSAKLTTVAQESKPVYQFGPRFLHFVPASISGGEGANADEDTGRWCVGKALVGATACDMYMRSNADTPLTTVDSGTWHVKVEHGAAEDMGAYLVALNVQAECRSFAPALPAAGTAAAKTAALPTVVGAAEGSIFGADASAKMQGGPSRVNRRLVLGASCFAAVLVLVSWVSLAGQISAVGELGGGQDRTCVEVEQAGLLKGDALRAGPY